MTRRPVEFDQEVWMNLIIKHADAVAQAWPEKKKLEVARKENKSVG
jgi:hypothetical protein